ncbi:MAG: hypothetical protein J0H17_02865 [Rhizobiales bacterium]|jgi:hypothetical protein|nr:hypothetical protein [Hyphomicrobiales bacterium]
MIRFVFRFFGLWALAAAFVALIYDGTKTIAGSQVYMTKLGDTWNALHSESLQRLQPMVEHYVGHWLWDPVILNILSAPTWAVFGVLGIFLMLLGRKKRRLIGYARN